MMTLRAAAAAAFAGSLGLLLSGCTGDDAGATFDAKAALAGSTRELPSGNYAFSVTTPDATAKGSLDLSTDSATLLTATSSSGATSVATTQYEVVLAELDRWVRVTTGDGSKSALVKGADGQTWFHVDSSKLTKGSTADLDLSDPDVTGVGALLKAVTAAKGNAKTITGRIDGTKVVSPDGFLDAETIKGMGTAASALPFTATLDGQGRLTKLAIKAPQSGSTPAGNWVFQLSSYGLQIAQVKPAGAVKELPAASYQLLNG